METKYADRGSCSGCGDCAEGREPRPILTDATQSGIRIEKSNKR